jgi:hypothetical protein
MQNAQRRRTTNIESMDVFDAAVEKGMSIPRSLDCLNIWSISLLDPSCAQKQLELMQDETKYRVEGCTAWLADGLDLQQSQYVLCSLSRG